VAERALTSILDVLLAEQVSFVLVGALAAVAQGAPLTTQDVDIVHARTPENLDRLMTALGKLNARSSHRAWPMSRRVILPVGERWKRKYVLKLPHRSE
jgi:hypothetical protein